MFSSRVKYFIKLLVSLSIIGLIISRIDWHAFGLTLKQADLRLLLLAFLLLWVERVWAVFKWRYLLRAQGGHISMWLLFRIYNIGAFWGLFLPSSLSTDVIRGYYLSRSTENIELSAASVAVDRMMGLLSLLFCCVFSVLMYSTTFAPEINRSIMLLAAGCALAACCAFWGAVPDFLERRILFFRRNPVGGKLIAMHRAFLDFKRFPLVMVNSFICSLVLQIIRVVTMYVTAYAFQIETELVKFFIVVPITVIVIMIPVSVGGLGVREGSFVGLFALVGMSVNQAFAISGTNSIMVTVIGLTGGIFYLSFKYNSRLSEKAATPGKVDSDLRK